MKNEEAITCIKMMFAFWANAHKLNVAQIEAAKDLAIAALGDGGFIETSKMVPLTLEQLRGMDGQPVFLPETNCWALVTKDVFVMLLTFPDGEKCSANDWYKQVGPVYAYLPAHIDQEAWTAEWKEYTGADAGFHYCSKCGQQAFNYEDGGEVVEVLSDFCPSCGRSTAPKGLAELEKRLRG